MKKLNSPKTVVFASVLMMFFLLLTGCTNSTIDRDPQGSNDKTQPEDVNLDTPQEIVEKTMSKKELSEIILSSQFDSPAFLKNLELAIQDTEMRAALEESTNQKDAAPCQKISIKDAQTRCLDSFYYQTAYTEKNIDACSKISEEFQQKDCQNQVYYSLANEKKDDSYCLKISDEFQQKDCKNTVAYGKAREKLDVDICEKIDNEGLKGICENDVKMLIEAKNSAPIVNDVPPVVEQPIVEVVPEEEVVAQPEVVTDESAPVN